MGCNGLLLRRSKECYEHHPPPYGGPTVQKQKPTVQKQTPTVQKQTPTVQKQKPTVQTQQIFCTDTKNLRLNSSNLAKTSSPLVKQRGVCFSKIRRQKHEHSRRFQRHSSR